MVWFRCLFDMFGDHTLSGWAKAGWTIVLVFVPWLGALIYLIARGRSMTERQLSTDLGSRPDRERQVPARLRCYRPGRVRCLESQGTRLIQPSTFKARSRTPTHLATRSARNGAEPWRTGGRPRTGWYPSNFGSRTPSPPVRSGS